MARLWEDMTTEQKLEWLRHEDQSTRQAIAGISARLDEVGGVMVELEKQIKELQAAIVRQKAQPRRILKLEKMPGTANR
jgi:predicted  nucleic acid-binding Zn-ribbon protein